MGRFLAALCCLALTSNARAQEAGATRPERLYLNSSVLLGSARVVSLGGAYVGVGEGAAGITSNLASLAHRSPELDRDWDLGVTLSWMNLPLGNPRKRDLDNDGVSDSARGNRQLLAGMLLQYKRFGLGFSLRNSTVDSCIVAGCSASNALSVTLTTTSLSGAVAFARDEFILGFGIFGAEATFNHLGESWHYGSTALALDFLYRPLNRPYRMGVALRPDVTGPWQPAAGQAPSIGGRQLYAAVVSPSVVSVGMSYRLGRGAHRYNQLSPAARRQYVEMGVGSELSEPVLPGDPTGRLLLSAQVDFVSGVENAIPLRSFTDLIPAQLIGGTFALVPRLGVEHETLLHRLRLRLGTFAEPSPFQGRPTRPHLTGGFELFLFEYVEQWSVSSSFDVASRYANAGISVGFWR